MPVRPLSPELEAYARDVLNENPKKLEDEIQLLKDWIAKQPHLRARTDDQWLAAFLRGCKFSMERAKEKIDIFYSLRSIAPEVNCLSRKDPKFLEILKSGIFLILPKTDGSVGPRVWLMRHGPFDFKKYTPYECMTVFHVMRMIVLLEDDNAVVCGMTQIGDCGGATFGTYSQVTPAMIRRMSIAYREGVPLRNKGQYYLNCHPALEKILKFSNTFLSDKLKERVHMYGKNYADLYQHVPKEILPVEYGGSGGTIQEIIDYWVEKIQEYSGWLEEDERFGTDEALRPGKPKTAEDMFGVDGSFRQLEFD